MLNPLDPSVPQRIPKQLKNMLSYASYDASYQLNWIVGTELMKKLLLCRPSCVHTIYCA